MLQSAQQTQSESSVFVGAAGGTRSTMILLYHLSTLPTCLLAWILVANLGETKTSHFATHASKYFCYLRRLNNSIPILV